MFYNIRTMMLDRFMEALIEDKHDLIVQEGVYSEKEIEEKIMITTLRLELLKQE